MDPLEHWKIFQIYIGRGLFGKQNIYLLSRPMGILIDYMEFFQFVISAGIGGFPVLVTWRNP